MNWQTLVGEHLESIGFIQSKGIPSIFYHPQRKIRTMVHGDDYLSVGSRCNILWLEKELKNKFDIKTNIIGTKMGDKKGLKILNRIVRFTTYGIQYEADPRHVEILVSSLGMENANSVSSPGKDDDDYNEGEENIVGSSTEFRALAARANYLAQDRPDIQFATKEVCRSMANPQLGDWQKLKRLVRYLKGKPRVIYNMHWQKQWANMEVYSDANWANCKTTRKSTSGGCILLGSHCIKSWSKTQSVIATSSAESELYALVRASQEALGMRTMLRDFGVTGGIKIKVDASAAISIVERTGLGKLKHISVQWLWVQQIAKRKELGYDKVKGQMNPADAMTKHLTRQVMENHIDRMNCMFAAGRAAEAPQMAKDAG